MFAKIQDAVAYLMVGSMVIMGVIGMLGLGTGKKVSQPMVLSADWKTIVSMTAVAFWLFIGAEYVIPISKDVKNAKRNVPLGMFLGLGLICVVQSVLVFGFHNYTPWDKLDTWTCRICCTGKIFWEMSEKYGWLLWRRWH